MGAGGTPDDGDYVSYSQLFEQQAMQKRKEAAHRQLGLYRSKSRTTNRYEYERRMRYVQDAKHQIEKARTPEDLEHTLREARRVLDVQEALLLPDQLMDQASVDWYGLANTGAQAAQDLARLQAQTLNDQVALAHQQANAAINTLGEPFRNPNPQHWKQDRVSPAMKKVRAQQAAARAEELRIRQLMIKAEEDYRKREHKLANPKMTFTPRVSSVYPAKTLDKVSALWNKLKDDPMFMGDQLPPIIDWPHEYRMIGMSLVDPVLDFQARWQGEPTLLDALKLLLHWENKNRPGRKKKYEEYMESLTDEQVDLLVERTASAWKEMKREQEEDLKRSFWEWLVSLFVNQKTQSAGPR